MRHIILDTETTGASFRKGDRIIEIGAVEMLSFVPTGRIFHAYLDPQYPIHWGATRVHGLRNQDLAGCPQFRDILPDFLDFVGDGHLLAHNAAFDRGFVNAELERHGAAPLGPEKWSCTVKMVEKRLPGGSAKLDEAVRRLGIATPDRKIHGALLDAAILAAVVARLHDAPLVDISALTANAIGLPGRGQTPKPVQIPASAQPAAPKAPTGGAKTLLTGQQRSEAQRILDVTARAYQEARDILDFVVLIEAEGISVRPNIVEVTGALQGMRFSGAGVHMTTVTAGFSIANFAHGPISYEMDRHRSKLLDARYRHDREIGPPSKAKTREIGVVEIGFVDRIRPRSSREVSQLDTRFTTPDEDSPSL